MANTLLTISQITPETLMVLENNLPFASQANRDYDDQFAVTGAKIGNTVNVRRPGRFIGAEGPALQVEDFTETSVPVVLTTQFHVDTQFTTQDLALSLDEFSDRIIRPTVAAIANKVDRDGLTMATNAVGNMVGTPGTTPNALLTYLTAGAYLDSEAAPRDGKRAVIISPFMAPAIVDDLKGLFVPPDKIAEQYRTGLMGQDSGGMNWKTDANVIAHTFGSWAGTAGAITVNGASQGLASGWARTSTINITSTEIGTLNVGDTITFAGVYGVNPQNRQSYGQLRNFVVTSAVGLTAGNTAVTIQPALIYGGQFQNVSATPASGAAVTPFNMASTTAGAVTSPQGILFHRNAFTLAMADLELPEGVHFAGRASDKEAGLSIRIVRQYTINNDSIPCRFDVLYGWAPLYPELACRVCG
jgi:hypothetical protein